MYESVTLFILLLRIEHCAVAAVVSQNVFPHLELRFWAIRRTLYMVSGSLLSGMFFGNVMHMLGRGSCHQIFITDSAGSESS